MEGSARTGRGHEDVLIFVLPFVILLLQAKILETYEGFNHCLQEVGIEASELPALRTPELCESMLLAQLPTSSPAVLTAMQPAVTPTAAAGV